MKSGGWRIVGYATLIVLLFLGSGCRRRTGSQPSGSETEKGAVVSETGATVTPSENTREQSQPVHDLASPTTNPGGEAAQGTESSVKEPIPGWEDLKKPSPAPTEPTGAAVLPENK